MPLRLPDTYMISDIEDRSLNDVLLAGEVDALITTRLPEGLGKGVRPLFTDVKAAERAYYDASGVFPIMHLLVLRREVYERDQTLARALYGAFLAAKRHSLERLYDIDALAVMVPWLVPEMAESFVVLGRDPWPYGCAANHNDFDVFLRYL